MLIAIARKIENEDSNQLVQPIDEKTEGKFLMMMGIFNTYQFISLHFRGNYAILNY